jgi:hypothetical protein
MFLTALLVLSMNWTKDNIPLQEAGQKTAPVCIEYCGQPTIIEGAQ